MKSKLRNQKSASERRTSPEALVAGVLATLAATLLAQATSPVTVPSAPRFDAVSIKRNTSGGASTTGPLPGGGYRILNGSVRSLIAPAFDEITGPPEGMPEWTTSERYDIIATSTLTGTPSLQDRETMIRAMLIDRFKFAGHFESRDQPAFDLVIARSDGRLGPGLKRSGADCAPAGAGRSGSGSTAAPPVPAASSSAPPCTGGGIPIAALARVLRTGADRPVVDKTGLSSDYRASLDMTRVAADTASPTSTGLSDDTQTIFQAVIEQLGLKLEPSKAPQKLLVVDRIERPTEN
jgi:uncharacterized protein (TIGR03435 family)